MLPERVVPRAEPRADPAGTDPDGDPDRSTILVVADEPRARRTLVDMLGSQGYRVIGAADAESAFDHVDQADLVLLDTELPETDGWAVCREIKDRIDPAKPIIMITNGGSPEDVVRTFDAGADDYVPRPFQVAEIRARIESRLRAHHAERMLHAANEQASDLARQNYDLYEQARRDAEDREDLLRELDHRVRNNLSIIMGLVSLERSRGAERPAGEALVSLENRLRAFLMAYESFRRSGYKGVPLRELADRMAQRLKNTLRPESRIVVRVSGDDLLVPERYGFALGLAINEVLGQALLRGFGETDEGTLSVGVEAVDAGIEIVISDDGAPGDERTESDASVPGPESVVRALVETELGGSVQVEEVERGARVRITCPVPLDAP